MFKLLEIHDLGSKGNNFCGRKILSNKSILALSKELILLWGKEENQNFARSLKEKGNNFNFTISLSTSFFLRVSENSTNVFRWDATSWLGVPENWSFITRFNKAALISQNSALVAGAEIGVLIKSLLLVLEKSQLGILLLHRDYANKNAHKNRSDEKTMNEKEGK